MKVKKGFMLREVAGSYIVVAIGEASKNFNGMIKLNKSGCYLWNCIIEDITIEELINKLLEKYEINNYIAKKDVETFIETLRNENILDE